MKNTGNQVEEKHRWLAVKGIVKTILSLLLVLGTVTLIPAQEKQVSVPAGSPLLVKLDKAVSSSDKPGTKFSGVLQGDLSANGVAVVKAGSPVYGEVANAKKAKRAR